MTKRVISLYGDSEKIEMAKAKHINMSKLFNDALETVLNLNLPDVRVDATMQELEQELETARKTKEEATLRIKAMVEQKKAMEESVKKQREEKYGRVLKEIVFK